ncbi:hypothetical protein F5B20DRAFT_178898 [Whalleya microplaca]|nr:hypothetical protein F5B20DRAFT_178898 [Whalleya microplaca]
MAARKVSGLNWTFTLFFSLLSVCLTLIILLSGVGGHIVAEYLTVNTVDLNVPAKLGSSKFLKDLSTIAGEDWVGPSANSRSLGLSKTYSLTLLTVCAEGDDSITCGPPKIGVSFIPESDLRLDSTSIQGTLSAAYSDQLQTYRKASTFLGVTYVLAVLLTGSSCILVVASRCFPRVIVVSLFSSFVAFLFLLAAAVTSVVTFVKLKDAFNDELGNSGLRTETGSRMFGLSFGAAGVAFAAFTATLAQARHERKRKYQGGSQGLDINKSPSSTDSGTQRAISMLKFPNRMLGWNRSKYTQIENQKPILYAHDAPHGGD